jgi:uncharacterized OsmC-like protein
MATHDIAQALERVRTVLARRPDMGLHDDAPATSRWTGGLRMLSSHANGTQVPTDMPAEFGGSGDQVSPGWMLRAGIASCTATCIAMAAAEQGIELEALEVQVQSRTDARGMIGMPDVDGTEVPAGPQDMQVIVKIAARDASAQRLRALVELNYQRSPMTCALQGATPVALHIEVGAPAGPG